MHGRNTVRTDKERERKKTGDEQVLQASKRGQMLHHISERYQKRYFTDKHKHQVSSLLSYQRRRRQSSSSTFCEDLQVTCHHAAAAAAVTIQRDYRNAVENERAWFVTTSSFLF